MSRRMTRYLAILAMVLATSGCSSRITGLGKVFPDMEGMRAILFGDQAARAEALSPDRARLAARLCGLYVIGGSDWNAAVGRVNFQKGTRPLLHAGLFPQTVWSFSDVPLVFVWPESEGQACVIAVFSGDREESVRKIVAEVGRKMKEESIGFDQSALDGLTFSGLAEAQMPPTLIGSADGAAGEVYYMDAQVLEVDDPFATSGAGFLFSLWRQDNAGTDGQS